MDQDIYRAMVEGLVKFPSSANSVSVKVSDGRMTLKGTTASAKDRQEILVLARELVGQDRVECRLAVLGDKPRRGIHHHILGH